VAEFGEKAATPRLPSASPLPVADLVASFSIASLNDIMLHSGINVVAIFDYSCTGANVYMLSTEAL
jgi:hypothetical protein